MEHERASQPWTNEKHSHYLDLMEASFVHTMLEDPSACRSLCLDGYMSDSCDSNQDLSSQARTKYPSSSSGTSRMEAKADKRWRRHAMDTNNDDPAFNQMVPQMSYNNSDRVSKDR